jgi:hypothetical protein
MSTGWTWDYVENRVTMFHVRALSRYWRQHPPMHLLLAADVGYKAPAAVAPTQSTPLPDIEE